MDEMIIYEFLYNSCTCESAAATISLHRTLKGAYEAMRKHRWDACVEDRNMKLQYGNHCLLKRWHWDSWKWWGIRKQELRP